MVKTKRGLPNMTWLPGKGLYRLRGTYKERKYSVTGKTPETVMEKIEAFKARVDAEPRQYDDMTMFQYVQKWYPVRISGLKPKSVGMYQNAVNRHILPALGNLKVTEVKPLHIDALLAGLSGKSSSLCQKVLVTARQIFDSAIENEVITKNPCFRKKAGGLPRKMKEALTREQQDTLYAAADGTDAELFILLCLYAGLRKEESLGLLWRNGKSVCRPESRPPRDWR